MIYPAPKPAPREKKKPSPIPRSSPPTRSGRPKPKKRKPSEFARTYGSRERVEWVKSRPCIVKGGQCYGPIENAHVVSDGSNGMGRKAGSRCIAPLCAKHHRILHNTGANDFEIQYGVSLAFAAAQTEQSWAGRAEGGR